MLKLKELRFSGIGRFVEEQVIPFESLGRMVQLDGENHNTGGSSGAGKSTVFQALEYLFGINKIPSTVLKSRQSENGISVQGTFDYDGKDLVITRSKKLKIVLDGITTVGSSDITEAKLDEILSVPRDLFRPMLHKRQKEGGFFLNMTPKAINDFLMSCMGLGHFKSKVEILDKKAKELSDKKALVSGSLESAKAALKATEEAVLSLGEPPIKEVHQSVILELKAKSEKSLAELSAIQLAHKLEIEALELSRPPISEAKFDSGLRDALEKQLRVVRDDQSHARLVERNRQVKIGEWISARTADTVSFNTMIKAAEVAKIEAVRIAMEIKKIRESICPTCEQGWVADNAKVTEAALLEKLSVLKKTITEGNYASEQLIPALADLAGWDAERIPRIPEGYLELENIEKQLHSDILEEKSKESAHGVEQSKLNREIIADFSSKQKALREDHTKASYQYYGQAEVDRRAFETAVSKLRAYEEARKRHETSLASLNERSASYKVKVDELTISSIETHNELAMTEELKRAIKSYLSCSFDEALETISENATKLIRNVPNTANATIQLEGQKETGDGKVKDEVNAVIHMDGDENIDIRSLCGGERTSADLAIDMSVIDFIENKANKGIDLFILDEPFESLDTVCTEMALEFLKNCSTNKRLIIVSHNPEVKEMVESRLTVVRDGATSIIRQS